MKHRRSIQSSPGALLWANDFAAYRYKIRYSVGANACQVVLGQSYHMRARNPGGQTLLGFFLENAQSIHSSTSELEMVVVAWNRYSKRHFQFSKER